MPKQNVVIIDYGLGNLFNVQSAMCAAGADVTISADPRDLAGATRAILPGVGAFADGMEGLRSRGLIQPLIDFANSGRPLMGVCLGMQLLLSRSDEFGQHDGLGLVEGNVVHFRPPLDSAPFKVPHIGWNSLVPVRQGKILDGLPAGADGVYLYYLHSFIAELKDQSSTLARTDYGRDSFCAIFQQRNIIGVQAHPERSGEAGIQLFRNFLREGEAT